MSVAEYIDSSVNLRECSKSASRLAARLASFRLRRSSFEEGERLLELTGQRQASKVLTLVAYRASCLRHDFYYDPFGAPPVFDLSDLGRCRTVARDLAPSADHPSRHLCLLAVRDLSPVLPARAWSLIPGRHDRYTLFPRYLKEA